MNIKRAYQKGVALVTVMLIAAIASVIAVKTTIGYQNSVSRTINIIGSDQGLLYIYSLENWLINMPAKDIQNISKDFPNGFWKFQVRLPIDGGTASGVLKDPTSGYNLNNLTDEDNVVIPKEFERLQRLMGLLGLPVGLADVIADWMDSDTNARPSGAEDSAYGVQDPPYRVANTKLADVTELRLMLGMNTEIYEKLKQYVTVLPLHTPINANFAKAETIMMLDEEVTPDMASEIVSRQNAREGFLSAESVLSLMQSYASNSSLTERVTAEDIGSSSQFFRLDATVLYNEARTRAISTLQRKKQNETRVISRVLGAWTDE